MCHRMIGEVTVAASFEDSLTVGLEFGATEIIATATNDSTKETRNAMLRYT